MVEGLTGTYQKLGVRLCCCYSAVLPRVYRDRPIHIEGKAMAAAQSHDDATLVLRKLLLDTNVGKGEEVKKSSWSTIKILDVPHLDWANGATYPARPVVLRIGASEAASPQNATGAAAMVQVNPPTPSSPS